MFKVRAKYLLLIAAAVWCAAGINILRLGILSAQDAKLHPAALTLGIVITFLLFHPMFSKLVGKHSDRIRSYGEQHMHVLKFFDVKGYIIMAIMMSGGIALRSFGILPPWVVAFFYTGLGMALTLGGFGFALHYIKRGGEIRCPITKKTRLA